MKNSLTHIKTFESFINESKLYGSLNESRLQDALYDFGSKPLMGKYILDFYDENNYNNIGIRLSDTPNDRHSSENSPEQTAYISYDITDKKWFFDDVDVKPTTEDDELLSTIASVIEKETLRINKFIDDKKKSILDKEIERSEEKKRIENKFKSIKKTK